MRYPKKVITDFSSLPREGLTYYKHTSSGGFKASETDSHLYIDGEGIPIDSVEFDIIKVKQRRRYRERLMEVYYDLGDGFTEQQCLKSQLRKGRVRFDFDEGPNVQGIHHAVALRDVIGDIVAHRLIRSLGIRSDGSPVEVHTKCRKTDCGGKEDLFFPAVFKKHRRKEEHPEGRKKKVRQRHFP